MKEMYTAILSIGKISGPKMLNTYSYKLNAIFSIDGTNQYMAKKEDDKIRVRNARS